MAGFSQPPWQIAKKIPEPLTEMEITRRDELGYSSSAVGATNSKIRATSLGRDMSRQSGDGFNDVLDSGASLARFTSAIENLPHCKL